MVKDREEGEDKEDKELDKEELNSVHSYYPGVFRYGTPSRANISDRTNILKPSVIDLLEFLHGLPDDPSTLSVVVLSSYGIWSLRTTY